MKGYVVSGGYMGYIPEKDEYQLFETEEAYKEWYLEHQSEETEET